MPADSVWPAVVTALVGRCWQNQIVYAIMTLLGAGLLLPYNVLITAVDFFNNQVGPAVHVSKAHCRSLGAGAVPWRQHRVPHPHHHAVPCAVHPVLHGAAQRVQLARPAVVTHCALCAVHPR